MSSPSAPHRDFPRSVPGPTGPAEARTPDDDGVSPGWYRESFGELYPLLYRHRSLDDAERETEFARARLSLEAGQRVLDLGCGAGRHLDPLIRRGVGVVGLDLSSALLAVARRRHREAGWSGGVVRGDMRRLPFGSAFDAVLSFFTSFGYFFDEAENERVLREIARVLRPRGRFLVDLMDARHVRAHLVPESERRVDGGVIRERRWLSADQRRVEKETRFVPAEPGVETRRFHESVRLYGVEEARSAFARAGLVIEKIGGDFAGSVHREGETPRMILEGHREGTAP